VKGPANCGKDKRFPILSRLGITGRAATTDDPHLAGPLAEAVISAPEQHRKNAVTRFTVTIYGAYGRGRTRTYDLTDVNRAL
jgi:hypothetical protein